MKLSGQIKNCLDSSGCKDCENYEPKSLLTCRGLLQKAYERIKEYEDMFPCEIGDTVYYRHDGVEIEPMLVEEITITECTTILTLKYFGNEEDLKYWRLRMDISSFDDNIVFLTREQAESALQKMNEMEGKE